MAQTYYRFTFYEYISMKRLIDIICRVARLSSLVALSPLFVLIPRKRNKILFGAWHGKQYSCNPKYLFEYMASKGGFECVWIGESHLRDSVLACHGAKFTKKGSLLALFHALTASYFACNVNWREDIINFPRFRRVELFYLTHGYADKNVGVLQFSGDGLRKKERASFQRIRDVMNWIEDLLYGFKSWCSESSEQGVAIRLSNQPFIMSEDMMLRFGKPRADYFIKNRDNAEEKKRAREKIAAILGLPLDKRWYLYAPTWRHSNNNVVSFSTISGRDKVEKVLNDQDAIIIEKHHPIVLQYTNINAAKHGCVYVLSREQTRQIDTQELLMASARLITDYSSIYYDFVLLDRPVIHFAYDYDNFMTRDMGFNFDMRDYGGGPFAYDIGEFTDVLALSDEKLLSMRNEATKRDQLTYEAGEACSKYYDFFLQRIAERGFFVR